MRTRRNVVLLLATVLAPVILAGQDRGNGQLSRMKAVPVAMHAETISCG